MSEGSLRNSSSESQKRYWLPTDRLLYGVIVKAFLPLKRHPELLYENGEFSNIYPGAEVYLFEETVDGKWCRAYLCARPLPEEFITFVSSVDDKLPDVKPRVVIFPRKICNVNMDKVVTTMAFSKLPELHDFDSMVSPECTAPSLYESLSTVNVNAVTSISNKKPARPGFPFFRFQQRPFIEEIGPILALISSHVYAMYSAGEFTIYEKLIELYYELDSIRLRLQFNLTTDSERITIIRTSTCLLTRISKFISSQGRSNRFFLKDAPASSDPYGFEGIFSRDINNGELQEYDTTGLQKLVVSSMLYGLTNTFPVMDSNILDPIVPTKDLFKETQSHILVDFKDVISDPSIINPKFESMTASVYLRTKTKVLTEPFVVNIYSDHITSLDNIASVLFKYISTNIIEHEKIYLTVILTEALPVNTSKEPSMSEFKKPFIPFKSEKEGRIKSVRCGVAAGIVDISAIFAKTNNTTIHDSAHTFTIRLYGSTFDDQSKANADQEKGWGGLIDKLLMNSKNGVVVNPRTISLSVTVKEILGETASTHITNSPIVAIKTVPTNFYDPVFNPKERIQLTLGKISLVGLEGKTTNIENITVQICSKNENVSFGKSTGDNGFDHWRFVSVSSGEFIGETVIVNGLDKMKEKETLRILIYLNGFLMAKSNIYIKKDNEVIEYPDGTTFQLLSSLGKPLLYLDIMTKYEGCTYNTDPVIKKFNSLLKEKDMNDPKFPELCRKVTEELNNVTKAQLFKHFEELLLNYLKLLSLIDADAAGPANADIFAVFMKFIFITLTFEENCRFKFHQLCKRYQHEKEKLPSIGPKILFHMKRILQDREHRSNEVNNMSYHVSIFLLLISGITSEGVENEWKVNFESFF